MFDFFKKTIEDFRDADISRRFEITPEELKAEKERIKKLEEQTSDGHKMLLKQDTRKFFRVCSIICIVVFSFMLYMSCNPFDAGHVIKNLLQILICIGIFILLFYKSRKAEIITIVLAIALIGIVYGSIFIN